MSDNPCNCGTCPPETYCPIIHESKCETTCCCKMLTITKTIGCFYHPKARETMMDPLIKELQRIRDVSLQSHWKERSVSINISDVIVLIKGGVKE